MKVFVILLLGVIFLALISSSVQSISADHSLGDQGIFKDENNVNVASTIDSKWLIHLQVVVRDAQDQLVSVTEASHGSYIPHKITDYFFDESLGKKEIITIDNVKYEKVRFMQTTTYCETLTDNLEDRWCRSGIQSHWTINTCIKTKEHGNEQGIACISIFQTLTPHISLEEDDVFTLNWTVLRELN
jgi:hypothetical protein